MTEDFNDCPMIIEDKQSILANKENCCLCGNKNGLIECGICGNRFCNDIGGDRDQSDLLIHFQDSNHNVIKIRTNKDSPNVFEELKCCICKKNDAFDLYILVNNNNCINVNKEIFCKEHAPKNNNNIQPIVEKKEKANESLNMDKEKKSKKIKVDKDKIYERQQLLKEFEEITSRKLNKVKPTYESKYDYYQIFKPLIVSDYLYTKKIYDNKISYDIDLLVNKNEKYYFEIPEDFIEINFSPGRVLKFIEIDKYEDEYYDENDLGDDYKPIQFVAVITNILYNDKKQIFNIWIMPINIHITSLKGREGTFKIKEQFCSIPYMRMLEALELFLNDENDDEGDGAVSIHIIRRILGQYPNNSQKNKNEEDLKSFMKAEEKALNSLFGKNINSKIET